MTTTARTNKHKQQDATGEKAASPLAKSLNEDSSTTDNIMKEEVVKRSTAELVEEHLPPLSLIFVVLICSGALLVLGLRDALATGKPIAGPLDEAMLQFTDSTMFFEGSLGWKSTQGGLSAISSITTDDNNMGGLFVRKMGGAAAAMVHAQKLLPLLWHPKGAQWTAGHFRPLFGMAIIANLVIMAFYGSYMEDLEAADAAGLAKFIVAVLGFESLAILFHVVTAKSKTTPTVAIAMRDGKTPTSATSRIVARTVAVVSSVVSVLLLRDLVFPGCIMEFIPRDDIYLEWTNAFLHSPPEGSPEAADQGLAAALFVGDKFVSQFMAIHMLLLVAYKFLTAFGIQYGNDGSGEIKCKMIWKTQAFADGFVLLMLRLFYAAALSASLDLRWHLMCVGYEGFILALYTWF